MIEERKRRLGPYEVRERTARRLVVERRRAVWAILAGVGGVGLFLALAVMPWLGGTRLYIALSVAGIALVVAVLTVALVPRLERLTVDLDTGEFRLERVALIPKGPLDFRPLVVSLAQVTKVRCRRRVWEDGPGAVAVRWAVELVGENRGWRVAEGEDEEAMQDLARLIAEVANFPWETSGPG